jgi:hypothetical protein
VQVNTGGQEWQSKTSLSIASCRDRVQHDERRGLSFPLVAAGMVLQNSMCKTE